MTAIVVGVVLGILVPIVGLTALAMLYANGERAEGQP